MAKKLILSEEKLAKAIKMYEEGNSLRSIATALGHSRRAITKILKENGVRIRTTKETSRRYTHNFDYFEVIDTQEKAYWLGFIYADGFIESKRKHGEQKVGITLSVKDKKHLEKFKASIQATNPILDYIGGGFDSEAVFSKILLTSQKTVDDLKRHGVTERKTFTLTFPDLKKELVPHFIRGYFDGDGTISVYENGFKFGFSSGSLEFLTSIKNFFSESNAQIRKDKSIYCFTIGGTKKAFKMLHKIYEDANIFLDRKYQLYQSIYEKYGESQGTIR